MRIICRLLRKSTLTSVVLELDWLVVASKHALGGHEEKHVVMVADMAALGGNHIFKAVEA